MKLQSTPIQDSPLMYLRIQSQSEVLIVTDSDIILLLFIIYQILD